MNNHIKPILKRMQALVLSIALAASLAPAALANTVSDGSQPLDTPAVQETSQSDNQTFTDTFTQSTTTINHPEIPLSDDTTNTGSPDLVLLPPEGQMDASSTSSSSPLALDQEMTAADENTAQNDITLSLDTLDATGTESALDDHSDPATTASSTLASDIDIDNSNDTLINNDVNASSTTGDNAIVSQDDVEDSKIETGDINVYANVLNVVNTNLYNSEINELVQNFDSLSADLFLNDPNASSQELAQDLVTKICTDVECKSLSSFTLTNQNLAAVNNDVSASGNSGGNSITGSDDVEDSVISTGDVNAVVNVLNIVNTNLVNSRWTFASINIFGDWDGDLVLPAELYFADYMTIGVPDDAAANLEQVKKVVLEAQNQNQAAIINDISTTADTGNNSLDAVVAPDGTDGDMQSSGIQTGTSTAASNVENYANINIVNTRWYLNLVNTLGSWTGNVYHLPGEVAMSPTLGGLSFFSTTASNKMSAYQAFADAIAEVNDDTAASSTSETDATTTIDNSNAAAIINDVDVNAQTGNNSMTGTDLKRSQILTGNARALANILNFANTNLIGSDLQVGLVNVFGNWNGDIIFGFPDLAVVQSLVSPAFPKEKSQPVSFRINYQNLGDSSMENTHLQWQYDPAVMSLSSSTASVTYTQTKPGVIDFSLGRIGPKFSGTLDLLMNTISSLAQGNEVTTYATIFGLGPESRQDNNESVLTSLASTTLASSGGTDHNGGGSGGNNSGGSSGGGSYSGYNLLRVHKSNNATGPLKNGDTVSFKLVIDNDGLNDLYNVVVYDSLRGPGNNVVAAKSYPLGKIASREEVVINYDLGIVALASDGVYTNSAYAEGLNLQFVPVRSESTALSSFTLQNSGGAGGSNLNDQTSQATSSPSDELDIPMQAIGIDYTYSKQNASSSPMAGTVAGASTQKPPKGPGGTANDPVEMFVPPAQASPDAKAATPDTPSLYQDRATVAKNSWSQELFGLFLLSFLIAFGYALANLMRRSKQDALGNGIIEGTAEDEPVPAPPTLEVKKAAARKNLARLRKKLDIDDIGADRI